MEFFSVGAGLSEDNVFFQQSLTMSITEITAHVSHMAKQILGHEFNGYEFNRRLFRMIVFALLTNK